jgi:hypothetical protein
MSSNIQDYAFAGGYPDEATIQRAYDDADLVRAIQLYKQFYAIVSGAAIFAGNARIGIVPNLTFGTMDTLPRHIGYTLNSDTPYAPVLLDLSNGPLVIELPPGPLISVAMDVGQGWLADLGVPGPDAGKGGKHVVVPPGYDGPIPDGAYRIQSTTTRVLCGVRSLPVGGDVAAADERLKTIKVYPLDPATPWEEPKWIDLTPDPQDTTPLAAERSLDYWRLLHHVVDTEPPIDSYRVLYGELAALGIEKGKPFAPDARLTGILERAALIANDQMRVQSFADRRPDREVWPGSQWQWASLRFEDGAFNTENYVDNIAREKWFFQAIGASPAMFRRSVGAGSLYWLGLRDSEGRYLDGGNTYRLTVPANVPDKLFWSVTVYDAETRSQIATDQGKAALRSLFELKDADPAQPIDLYFGPSQPEGAENRWIETIPGTGWFVYFRIYGPEGPAFDGSWKPGEFERLDQK